MKPVKGWVVPILYKCYDCGDEYYGDDTECIAEILEEGICICKWCKEFE